MLIVAAVLFFLSALGCTLSPSFTILVLVRIVGGIGVGIASVVSPLYISEFSPPKIRGRLVALYQLSIVTGILLANLGTPDEPTPEALRRYLAEFLWDPRIVDMPRPLWWLILHKDHTF